MATNEYRNWFHSHSFSQQVICGLPVYVKFAGATVGVLRRWLVATNLDDADEYTREMYFLELSTLQSDESSSCMELVKYTDGSGSKKTEKRQFSHELLDQYSSCVCVCVCMLSALLLLL